MVSNDGMSGTRDLTDEASDFEGGSPGSSRRHSRWSTTHRVPPDLAQVLRSLEKEQPVRGYADKNAVRGAISKVNGWDEQGPRDELYRFLQAQGVICRPEREWAEILSGVHFYDSARAQLVLEACEAGQALDLPSDAVILARFMQLAYAVGYRLERSGGQRERRDPVPKDSGKKGKVSKLGDMPPNTICDLVGVPDLFQEPALLGTLSNSELDELTSRVVDQHESCDRLLELIVADKARREREAEANRQREADRRRMAEEVAAKEQELLARMEAAEEAKRRADAAQREAAQAAAAQREAEQALAELQRKKATL